MLFNFTLKHSHPKIIGAIIILLCSCTGKEHGKLFSLLPKDKTGITFTNAIQENEEFNVMTYQYLYNGGGVAVGDINGDGLADVFFTGNMVPNALYLNKGNLKFKEITATAGVAGRRQWKTGTCMADVNGDGLLDIYVCYSGPGTDAERKNELYINNGDKDNVSFTESAEQYGLDAPGTFTTQVVFFDMDLDGDLDLFMVNHADMFYNSFFNTNHLRNLRHPKFGNRLYKNDNGKYADISEEAGIHGSGLNFGLSVSVGDLNMDGWPDLYVTNDYNEQDFLYLNNHNNKFREVLKSSMGHISKFSMGSDIGDFNNDLRPDVISMDMLPEDNKRQKGLKGPDNYDIYHLLADSGFHYQEMRNMLHVNVAANDDTSLFSEIGQLAGISNTDWSWAPLFCDLNNDGWKDLYITNGYLRDFTNMDFLKYTFQEEASKSQRDGIPMNKWELVKKMPATKISNYCYANNNNLTFTNTTQSWGLYHPSISTGAAYADLDNDGDLDIIVNNSNEVASLFENHLNETGAAHYLRIRLKGEGRNRFGIGAKVIIQTDSLSQMQELYTARGFQSSVEPLIHFGLGTSENIKSVNVYWANGKQTKLQNIACDTTITIAEQLDQPINNMPQASSAWFRDFTDSSGLQYEHKETSYNDFKHQFLLLNEISKQGPFLTKGDVNGDGLEDVFVGGNFRRSGKLFLQTSNEKFSASASQPWQYKHGAKDVGVLFFDADGDKDLDLFIVRGGSELPIGDPGYQDQLYLNGGNGNFKLLQRGLPPLLSNGSCVAASDFDKDGDLDLFIGGRSIPNSYPVTDFSYLLRNETRGGNIRFEYAVEQGDKSLRHPGIVTSAAWADINNDSWDDLIVAGEFMPITIYENRQGKLMNATKEFGLEKSNGLWSKIVVSDMDNDGDMDIVAGNMGQNSQFRASEKEPLSICYGDFDGNGSIDPLACYYIQGKQWPVASLDELAEQLPGLRKKFLHYEQYASATLDQILTPQQLKDATTLNAYNLSTCYLENRNNRFIIKPLPIQTQFSKVAGIVVQDFDGDGKKDILVHGNDFTWRVQLGRMDASFGTVCKGDGKGNFQALPISKTGVLSNGDVRDMNFISSGNKKFIVTTSNNSSVSVINIIPQNIR